jgi:hypothetical protein
MWTKKKSRGYYDIFCVFKTSTIDAAVKVMYQDGFKAMYQDGCKSQRWKKRVTALEQ